VEDSSDLQLLRSGLVTAALEERRQIERALHDGPQQDLIAISVRLQLLRDVVATSPADAIASLDEIRGEVKTALNRLRTLASEIYPAILDSRGLPDALRQAAGASGAETYVEASALGRYPADVEAAVFFLWRGVLDGLGSGRKAVIQVREEDKALHVAIDGGRPVDLARVRDLVEGAGGALTTESEPAPVEARFPLA
jgi:signal transduction histidine kinase